MTNQMVKEQCYPDREKCVGEWLVGGFRNGKCYDKDGTIQYNYVNGKKDRTITPLKPTNKL